MLEATDALT